MSKFVLTIDLDNEAFQSDPGIELARILQGLVEQIAIFQSTRFATPTATPLGGGR